MLKNIKEFYMLYRYNKARKAPFSMHWHNFKHYFLNYSACIKYIG